MKNHKKRIQLSQSGFSLIEILVAIGLISILAAGMAAMSTNSMKAANKVEGSYSLSKLVQTIDRYSFYQTSCKNMLTGTTKIDYDSMNSDTITPFEFKLNGTELVSSGQVLKQYSLSVKKFELKNMQKIGVDCNLNKFLVGSLFIEAELLKVSVGGNSYKERPITTLTLKLDNNGIVVDCSSSNLAMNLSPTACLTSSSSGGG